MAEIQTQYKPLLLSELSPSMNVTLVQDGAGLEKLKKCIARIMGSTTIAGLDTETNVVTDFYNRRIRTLQTGDKEEQFVIDLLSFAETEERLIAAQGLYGKNSNGVFDPILKVLEPMICSNRVLKVGQNLGYEYEVIHWNLGRRIWHLYSTDLAERVIQAGAISLKKYAEFSMESLCHRYLKRQIDKSHQTSFDLKTPLSPEQVMYGALDIRLPLPIRQYQMAILQKDQLITTATIENDALGTYVDMHLVGQNLDDERWLRRIEAVKLRRKAEVEEMDRSFIPVVGHKDEAVDEEEIARREDVWKNNFEAATPEELAKAIEIRQEKDKEKKNVLRAELEQLKDVRRANKAEARRAVTELTKARTQAKKILEKCEGNAFINYGSNAQLLAALQKFTGMKTLSSVADDHLLKYNDRPLIQTIRKYRKGKKDTGTYGVQWVTRWLTKPLSKEGWRHPVDGRLHCGFNQLEAETGRSSSEKPNAMNLPQDDEVRACFICDPPNPDVRISVCCDSDTSFREGVHVCDKCMTQACETKDEEYCIVTIDMSGAELRIIAELANAKSWIDAFAKGHDVHSVSTEILQPEEWPKAQCIGGEIYFDKEKGKDVILPPCAYYARDEKGECKRQKCKCPGHVEMRNATKAINFLLCYGGGPDALADALGISTDAAKDLMELHESKFPDVWGYLRASGERAKKYNQARDMYGRRRLLPDPTVERAIDWYQEEYEERLELEEEDAEESIFKFKAKEMREPNKDELWGLTHRAMTPAEVQQGLRALKGSIGRQGKNHCIQGTNASIIKRAMGCGFDKNGKGYLWHTLPQYKARIQNMVHDELVVHCPKRYAEQVAQEVGSAFKRAAAEVMKKVIMEFDYHISNRWMK